MDRWRDDLGAYDGSLRVSTWALSWMMIGLWFKTKTRCVVKTGLAKALDVIEHIHSHCLDAVNLPLSSQALGASANVATAGHHALAPSSSALRYLVMKIVHLPGLPFKNCSPDLGLESCFDERDSALDMV
jgi:hypothetical protein